jgi:hypothetical protein
VHFIATVAMLSIYCCRRLQCEVPLHMLHELTNTDIDVDSNDILYAGLEEPD